MSRRPGAFARFFGLIRGWFTGWVREREEDNPRAVYENAIQERVRQYRDLKEAVAGILYMRNKLEAELTESRRELAKTHEDIRRAVRRDDDDAALVLIQHRQGLEADIERAQKEVEGLRSEAEEAKTNLVRFRDEIRSLEREKGRVIATLANAKARRRIQEALEGMSVDADMRALESVRTHVARLSTEGELDRELGIESGLTQRLRAIRKEATNEGARLELEELKREMHPGALAAESSAVPTPATRSTSAPLPS